MEKSFLYLSLSILLIINTHFINAQQIITIDDVSFDLSTGTITDYLGTHTDIIIPQFFDIGGEITYIKTIGGGAFYNNNLTSIIIAEGIETIKSSAFLSNKLTEINIPKSVNYLGSGAFNNNLISMVNGELSNGMLYHRNDDGSIDSSMTISYGGASDIVDFIPDNVKTLGSFTFYLCGITEVILPKSLNTIERGAFQYNNIEAFTIPDSVYFIDELAFENNKFDSIALPAPVIKDTTRFVNWKDKYGTVVTHITSRSDPSLSYSAHFFKDELEYPEINMISYIHAINSPGHAYPDGVNCISYNTLDVSISLGNYPITLDYTDVNIRSNHQPHNILCTKRVFFKTRDGVLFTIIEGRERRLKRDVFSLYFDLEELTENQVHIEAILYGNGQIKGYTTESIYDYIFKPYIYEEPSASPIQEGESLQNSILTDGRASVCGEFRFINPEFIPSVGTYEADIEFIPTRSDIYSTVETKVLVEVGVSTGLSAARDNLAIIHYEPFANRVTVDTGVEKILDISIYNTVGALIANFKGNGSTKQRINLGFKNARICLVKVSTMNKIITRKLLLQ